jgi:small subunit ribosomal protein S24e
MQSRQGDFSMQLKIINKTEEPLLSRTRLEGEAVFESVTPSNSEVRAAIAKSIGKDEKLIVVKGIYTQYGSKKAKIIAYAYQNSEIMLKIEPKNKKIDEAEKKSLEQKKVEEPKKEGKKEEKPKEEKAEEKKPEK